MDNSVELDIIVKIANIGYTINYNNSSLDNNNIAIENANLEWTHTPCLSLFISSFLLDGIVYNRSLCLMLKVLTQTSMNIITLRTSSSK